MIFPQQSRVPVTESIFGTTHGMYTSTREPFAGHSVKRHVSKEIKGSVQSPVQLETITDLPSRYKVKGLICTVI